MIALRRSWVLVVTAGLALGMGFVAPDHAPADDTFWRPGASDKALPGLIPAPAEIPGVGRWQIMAAPVSAYVQTVKFSPDGRLIAFGDGKYARIHEANSLRLEAALVGHSENVTAVDWSTDGKWLATAAEDGTVRLWQAHGVPGPVLKGHTDAVRDVAWRPDGQQLASASVDGTVRIWNADGTQAVAIEGHQAPVNAVDWHPDGKTLAAGDNKRTVRIWNADGSAGPVIEGLAGSIRKVEFSPDGKWLLTGSEAVPRGEAVNDKIGDNVTVRLWDLTGEDGPQEHGALLMNMQQNMTPPVYDITWKGDSSQFAVATQGGPTTVWNVDGTMVDEVQRESGTENIIMSIDWHPQVDYFVIGGRFVIRYSTIDGQIGPGKLIRPRGSKLMFVDWSPTENKIAVGGRDGNIHIWSDDFASRQTIDAFDSPATCVRFRPDGKQLAAIGSQSLKIWDSAGNLINEYPLEGSIMRDIAWSSDGKLVAACSEYNGKVFIFNEEGPVFQFADHNGRIYGVSFSPDTTKLVTGGGDDTVRMHNLAGGAVHRTPTSVMAVGDGDVDSIAFSPDGQWFASGHNTTVRLWKPDGTEGPVIPAATAAVLRLDWRPDGRAFATGSWDTHVKIFKTDGSLLKQLPSHAAPCWGVSFSPDGKRLASCGWDGILRVVDAESGDVRSLAVYVSDTTVVENDENERLQSPASFSRAGQLLSGDPNVLEVRFIYLVEQPNGAMEILKPSEFFAKVKAAQTAGTGSKEQ